MGRRHLEILQSEDVDWQQLPASDWPVGARIKVLSRDDETGALTGLLALPAGYRRGPGMIGVGSEFLVLKGTLTIGAEVHAPGYYEYMPAGAAQDEWAADDECELLLMAKGQPDFTPGRDGETPDGRIAIDTERVPWKRGRVPGPPPGLFSKVLRHDPATGERVFLCGCVRRYVYPLIEYHDCAEEAYHIAGDMRMGTSGLMRAGSYFWRPPYVSHGPFYSREGMMALLTVDGPLINHFVDDPRRTVEENRAEAEALGPPRDYFAEAKS